ncbi:MAG: glycosyltransferase, partial [Pseudomonadales bacterium]
VINCLSGSNQVQIFHLSELIGYARLQKSQFTPDDITYSHFEFYVEKPLKQISARYTDEGRTDGGKAVQPKSVEASLNSLPNQGVGYSSVEDFLNRPVADTPAVAPCSKKLIRAFIANKRELLRQANPADCSDIKISVVMPVFNRQSLAPMAIQSVVQQRMPNWELIIVDDGSTDKSLQTVRQTVKELDIEHKTQILALETNRGVSHARNQGLAVARGPIIAYLDSDNSWDRDYLYLITAAFEKNPDIDSVYTGQYVYFFNEILQRRYLAGIRIQPFNRELLEQENYIDLNIFAHRKKLYDQKGGFNEQMRRLVDWDLILKYTQEQEPLMIPALLAQYNMGIAENQITLNVTF